MTDTQFARITTYGLVSPGKKSTVSGVVGEGLRAPSKCRHVPSPMEPIVLFGEDLGDIPKNLRKEKKAFEKKHDRKLLDHAQIFAGYIASYPRTTAFLMEPTDAAALEYQAYLQWQDLVILDLKGMDEANPQCKLVGILAHWDEEFVHIHGWFAAREYKNQFTLGALHPGQHAEKGKAPKDRIPAYKAAMVSWQDQRWNNVGRHCGHARLSAKPQPRLTWQEAMMQKRVKKRYEELAAKQQQEENDLEDLRRNPRHARNIHM